MTFLEGWDRDSQGGWGTETWRQVERENRNRKEEPRRRETGRDENKDRNRGYRETRRQVDKMTGREEERERNASIAHQNPIQGPSCQLPVASSQLPECLLVRLGRPSGATTTCTAPAPENKPTYLPAYLPPCRNLTPHLVCGIFLDFQHPPQSPIHLHDCMSTTTNMSTKTEHNDDSDAPGQRDVGLPNAGLPSVTIPTIDNRWVNHDLEWVLLAVLL